jgi:hypothetical protein
MQKSSRRFSETFVDLDGAQPLRVRHPIGPNCNAAM